MDAHKPLFPTPPFGAYLQGDGIMLFEGAPDQIGFLHDDDLHRTLRKLPHAIIRRRDLHDPAQRQAVIGVLDYIQRNSVTFEKAQLLAGPGPSSGSLKEMPHLDAISALAKYFGQVSRKQRIFAEAPYQTLKTAYSKPDGATLAKWNDAEKSFDDTVRELPFLVKAFGYSYVHHVMLFPDSVEGQDVNGRSHPILGIKLFGKNIANPYTITEEIIHNADAHILFTPIRDEYYKIEFLGQNNKSNKPDHFSLQDFWKNAVDADLGAASRNPIALSLLGMLEKTLGKRNSFHKLRPGDERHLEALVDFANMYLMLERTPMLAQSLKQTMKPATQEILRQAFPHMSAAFLTPMEKSLVLNEQGLPVAVEAQEDRKIHSFIQLSQLRIGREKLEFDAKHIRKEDVRDPFARHYVVERLVSGWEFEPDEQLDKIFGKQPKVPPIPFPGGNRGR